MSSFERFLAGEDRLAGLLQALPAYAPSPTFEAAFTAAAQAAQAAVGAASSRELAAGGCSYENQLSQISFEPPASLETSFLKMAASIDAAQGPRRDALLAGIARGDSPEALLGADLQPATKKWLKAHTEQHTPAPPPAARKAVWLGVSWFDLRLAALACVLAAVAVQLTLKYLPTPQAIATRQAFTRIFELRQTLNSPAAEQTARPEPQVIPPAAIADKIAAAEASRQRLPAKPPSAEASKKTSPIHAPTAEPPKAEEPLQDSLSASITPQASPTLAVQAAPLQRPAASGAPAMLSKEDAAPARERSAAPSPRADMAEMKIPAPAAAPASPLPAAQRNEMPHAAPMAAPALKAQAASTRDSLLAKLSDEPTAIASRLPARPPGALWVIECAQPAQAEIKAWLSRLQAAMPRESGARFELREDRSLAPDSLRIVPPTP